MTTPTEARQAGVASPLALFLTILLASPALPPPAGAKAVDSWTFYYAAQEHFYNVEYDEAIRDLEQALGREPNNPFFLNALANDHLFQELRRLGQLEGNLYDASNSFLKQKKPEPDPKLMARVKELLQRTREACEARLKANPRDVDALYNLGVTYATEGNYKFTVEKSWYDALRAGSKANDLHRKVLEIDPNYHDAKLVLGAYQYVVDSIPRSVKWLAFLLGYSGSKQRGVQLMHEAMTKGKLVTSAAAFLLAVIYTREKQHGYSRQLLASLQGYYPRNPLIPLEIGRSFAREGKTREALQQYVTVARDMEAGKPGYHKLPRERLWYQIGDLYYKQGQFEEALQAFAKVTDHNEGDGLLKAYSGLRRGEIFQSQNRMELARAEYRRVARLPYEETRLQAEQRLRQLGD